MPRSRLVYSMTHERSRACQSAATVRVVGLFYREMGADPARPFALRAWYVAPVDAPRAAAPKRAIDARAVSLQELVYGSGRYDGQLVRVRGTYRGANRDADLPEKTRKGRGDWVIKDGLFAIWISGRKPKGDGFALDTGLKRDTGKWLEVVGRPETRNGVTYLRAVRVSLGAQPSASAPAQLPSPPPERPKVPPVVVFAIPLDGEVEVRRRGRRVARLGPGSFVGEIALLSRSPRTATVVATTPLRVLAITGRDFVALLDSLPELWLKVARTLADRVDADEALDATETV